MSIKIDLTRFERANSLEELVRSQGTQLPTDRKSLYADILPKEETPESFIARLEQLRDEDKRAFNQ
ncbi:hypothetical protein [Fimbriimonas ginsengisoli]|uniref:Uncharacterized protein n=1 Tax=Fimbriimonas ginsengisoli Gsoil 348 TaxID=661478 RepID=A0A068NQB0_FIMGI|nr:hypothetical protein [Fimbriimonas ginsengisoli]AIE85586.1 hypothetical protein OP10G_2218 [Fimbriimonas ginsengisoli Gsoil 348]